METYYDLLSQRIKEYEEENKILWNAVRDVMNAQSLGEAVTIARKADDALDPFLPLIKTERREDIAA